MTTFGCSSSEELSGKLTGNSSTQDVLWLELIGFIIHFIIVIIIVPSLECLV